MDDAPIYYYQKMPDVNLGIDIFMKDGLTRGGILKAHWHEHMQLYYFVGGSAILECGRNRFLVSSGSIVVINSNEVHYLESLSDDLEFYVIRIDPSFLSSNRVDSLQAKYLVPLSQNLISFQNRIEGDAQILECVMRTIQEYSVKGIGYELAVKSSIYQLLVLLLRGYVVKILTRNELEAKARSLKRFDVVFQKIEENYAENISVKALASSMDISVSHFCRIFKKITGKTTTDYINELRLEKATAYLERQDLNITEIAMECGFDSVNYFSRLFRKFYHVSPTKFREVYR